MEKHTDWKVCLDCLCEALLAIDPCDDTKTLFFFLRLSKLIDSAEEDFLKYITYVSA